MRAASCHRRSFLADHLPSRQLRRLAAGARRDWCGHVERSDVARRGSLWLRKAAFTLGRAAGPRIPRSNAPGTRVIRHTTATHLLRAGVDINTIRAWLGHVSIDTTNVYAEVHLETKAKMLAACRSFTAGAAPTKRWRDEASLMQGLRSL
jgi:integrase